MKENVDGIAELLQKNPIYETLFIPLYLKALETGKKNPIVVDQKAVSIIESIDYDFSYLKRNRNTQYHIAGRTLVQIFELEYSA